MSQDNDRKLFDNAISTLKAEILNVGTHLAWDATARNLYVNEIRKTAEELIRQVESGGKIAGEKATWAKAAAEAHKLRNDTVDIMRDKSSPVGRAYAQRLKPEGKKLTILIAEKVAEKYPGARFEHLSTAQRNNVYAAVVKSSGKSRQKVTNAMRRWSGIGRGLIILSVAISVYNVTVAEDKTQAIAREASIAGAGIAGGIGGGALAGLACGPGAPICVTVGMFVGGALAAFGISLFW